MSDKVEIVPWTVKGVPQADRDEIGNAAKRALTSIGPWLVTAAREKISRERTSVIPSSVPVPVDFVPASEPAVGHVPGVSMKELVDVLRQLPDLEADKQNRGITRLMRRAIRTQLEAMLPRKPPAPTAALAIEPPRKGA